MPPIPPRFGRFNQTGLDGVRRSGRGNGGRGFGVKPYGAGIWFTALDGVGCKKTARAVGLFSDVGADGETRTPTFCNART